MRIETQKVKRSESTSKSRSSATATTSTILFISIVSFGFCLHLSMIHLRNTSLAQPTVSDGPPTSRAMMTPATASASEATESSTPQSLEIFSICDTGRMGLEPISESLLGMIFRESGFLPTEGQILDVGAQMGEQACRCALLAPDRQVIAMDPSPEQIDRMLHRSKFSNKLPNLRLIQSGIGSEPSKYTISEDDLHMEGGGGFTGLNAGDTIEITTLDHLFFDQGQKLAFAHIDVEGRELETLKGGRKTILDNFPVFTTEVAVHRDSAYTKALLDYLDELGYDSYVIDEVCGDPRMDFRNLLNIPRKSLSKRLQHSDAFTFALASELLWRVDSTSIFGTVLPCCALGGECCPVESTNHKDCCTEKPVLDWMKHNPRDRPVAITSWHTSRRANLKRWKDLGRRGDIA